jgi:hypothetical protein
MGATLLPGRHRRRQLAGLRGRENLKPADHMARLRKKADARGADALTLEEFIAGVWEGLNARGTVNCPICGGEMEQRHAVTTATDVTATCADVTGDGLRGECGDCGTQLS